MLIGCVNIASSQNDGVQNPKFNEKLGMIRLLTDTQQYSEAMRQLKVIEKEYSSDIESSLKNEVNYRMMVARVLRLSNEFDDAMVQLNLLPDLSTEPNLELEVSFRKAALFNENPKFTMEERVKIVYPIIEKGILDSKKENNIPSLASFYNLYASTHFDQCTYLKVDCKKHRNISAKSYVKAMKLFISINDTLNYHNSLNGLFRTAIVEEYSNLDSIKRLVSKYADESNYFPNLTFSRSLLGQYYIRIKNDSLAFFRQTILEKNAMIDAVNKNADNSIEKLKLLYEFDSLKADLDLKENVLAQKELVIKEKNQRITENVLYSFILGALAIFLVLLLFRQRVLTKRIKNSNLDLNKSNHNYQLLIKESNHRIKNNLQMILSIIELDKKEAQIKSNELLDNISTKIMTISSLHKILDFKEHNQKVILGTYFNEIVEYYQNLTEFKIEFETDFASLEIGSERIVYFGLIINELISNTLKHRKLKDKITIKVISNKNSFTFTYRDNSDFKDFEKANGIFLIENLVNRFAGKEFKFDSQCGEYKFKFYE